MMASFQFVLLVLCSCIYIFKFNPSYAQISNLPVSCLVLLPVTKDPATFQYLTTIYHGTPQEPIKLVLDLGCPSLWVDCSSGHVSLSRRPIPSCSIQCPTAKPSNMSRAFSASRTTCDLSTENSITGSATRGVLVEDIWTIRSVDGSKSGAVATVDRFLLSCAPKFLLNRLAKGAQGMLGLGKTRTALPSQLASKFGFQRKFATCISSSSDGLIIFGNEPGYDSIFGAEISRSLVYTPLVTNPDGSGSGSSQEYSINVKSIKINGKRLSLGQEGIGGGTKISTTVHYTTLESSIYSTFTKAYTEAATNMTIVAPVAPFGLCFSSKEIGSTLLGPMVPTIDLVLQSEMVKWRVHGRNAMVPVSDEVMCLGFLDGGFNSKTSIVIGGFQLEDNILEFNLGTSMLGFSSSLLTRQTSCSLMFQSIIKDSL